MAAAIATIGLLAGTDALARMNAAGQQLREGLQRSAIRHGVDLRQSGPVSMPLLLFGKDDNFRLADTFCATALRHGAYFHPRHNLFLSAAHGTRDIEQAVAAADAGIAAVARDIR
jgi:glutamate-1-semialdehyde 2,1-aminomutase